MLCRTQEARQRAIAAASSLENVKAVANAAAAAWAKEALAADLREDRKSHAAELRRQAISDSNILGVEALPSENPDRGLAVSARSCFSAS
jgi:hypothetical protein